MTSIPQEKNSAGAETSQFESRDITSANNTKRRSFFGRLFQPSTENLAASNSKRAASRMPTRHARQTSQQSLASTADTYGEVLERDDVDGVTTNSARKLHEQQALMGREVPKSPKRSDDNRRKSTHESRRSIHAPIPNPRRASCGNDARAQTTDRRELSVIEDEGVNDEQSGDEGGEAVAAGHENETPEATNVSEKAEGEQESDSQEASPSPEAPNISTAPPSNPDQSDAAETGPPQVKDPPRPVPVDDQSDPEEARKIPTAPPSPSLEHELEVMGGDKARKLDKAASVEI